MTDVVQISCREVVELVTEYLEGALSDVDRRRFEEHVEACSGCRAYLRQLRRVIELTGTLAPDDLSPEAEAALVEAFSGWARS
jgi:predicted anti-sigma-YlaC factor YlaD